MKRPVAIAAASLIAKLKAGPDGFIRLQIDERDWICLAMGCAHGLQDLLALWIDGDAAHMALGAPALKLRVIVSLPLRRGSFPFALNAPFRISMALNRWEFPTRATGSITANGHPRRQA